MPMNKIPKLREPRGPIVQEVRDLFLERHYKSSPGDYYLEDICMIESMDFLLQRCVIMQRKDVEASAKMVSQVLKWRKEKQLYELNESSFPQELTLSGAAFLYDEDNFGNRTLYLRGNMCKNCVELKQSMKNFISYLLFKLDDPKHGSTFSVIMDLTNTTWSNYDLDLLSHFVALLKDYFPVNLDYVLAVNFPWILSAAWTVIKRLIPAEKRDVVQFIGSDKIFDFIAKEKCPDFLDGTSTRPYKFLHKDAPTSLEYLVHHSNKTITKKRLGEILAMYSDNLPQEHSRKLKAQLEQVKENKDGIELDESVLASINHNNNNIIEDKLKTTLANGLVENTCDTKSKKKRQSNKE